MAASIWRRCFIHADVLEKSIVCITFGHPLLTIPLVQEVARCNPKFEDTIHAVFDKDDIVPQLLQYFEFGSTYYRGNGVAMKALTSASGASTKGAKPGVPDNKPKIVSLICKERSNWDSA